MERHKQRRLDYYLDNNGEPVPYVHLRMTKIRLSILKTLNQFHNLDTLLLYRLVEQDIGKLNYCKFQHTLTDLRKIAGYIHCPEHQYRTNNSDHKKLVYSLTRRGKEILKENGIKVQEWGLHSSSLPHDWMTAHCVASMRLAAGDTYIPPTEIANRVTIDKPFQFPISNDKTLYPDFPVFGFMVGERFVIWETDCDTETIKELVEKIKAYLELDKADYFYKRLGIPSNYLCIVTTDQAHLEGILKQAPKSKIVLYQKIPHFSTLEHTPEPYTHLWDGPWKRKGYADFVFSNPSEE